MRHSPLFEHFKGLRELLDLHAEADARTSSFLRLSGLGCLPGCGSCCDAPSASIECTVLEAMPMALMLWDTGRAGAAHNLASDASDTGRCVLYSGPSLERGLGGCSEYASRPLVCRLFGFSSVRDKRGQSRLSLCGRVRQSHAARAHAASEMVTTGVDLPSLAGFHTRARGLNPALAAQRSGINTALMKALERVMLTARMMGLSPSGGQRQRGEGGLVEGQAL